MNAATNVQAAASASVEQTSMARKLVGRTCLAGYQTWLRGRSKLLSLLISGSFASFGKRTVLTHPIRLGGTERISIGTGVFMGADCWLQALPDGDCQDVAISIGDGCSVAGGCVISAVRQIVLEDHVLLARNVYIADHMHEYRRPNIPILVQGVTKMQPVRISQGAWLGQNVVVCPGVTVGKRAVVGANSVVNTDIPDFCVAAGSPARVIKTIDFREP
jgi:acetyltransferase-like isoleucine patch superfamily enzyme